MLRSPRRRHGALGSGRSTRNPTKDHLDKTPMMVHGYEAAPPAAVRPLMVAPGSITSPGSNRMHCPPLGAPPIRPAGATSEQYPQNWVMTRYLSAGAVNRSASGQEYGGLGSHPASMAVPCTSVPESVPFESCWACVTVPRTVRASTEDIITVEKRITSSFGFSGHRGPVAETACKSSEQCSLGHQPPMAMHPRREGPCVRRLAGPEKTPGAAGGRRAGQTGGRGEGPPPFEAPICS